MRYRTSRGVLEWSRGKDRYIGRRVFVTPRDRCSRRLPYIPGFAFCFISACPFIFALHHVIMPSCHLIFLTQLNKWHGSLIHLNRGNSHGDSLYNISSRWQGAILNIPFSESPITNLQFITCPFPLQDWSPNFSCKFFRHFPELHLISQHFWALQNPSPSSNHLIKFK